MGVPAFSPEIMEALRVARIIERRNRTVTPKMPIMERIIDARALALDRGMPLEGLVCWLGPDETREFWQWAIEELPMSSSKAHLGDDVKVFGLTIRSRMDPGILLTNERTSVARGFVECQYCGRDGDGTSCVSCGAPLNRKRTSGGMDVLVGKSFTDWSADRRRR